VDQELWAEAISAAELSLEVPLRESNPRVRSDFCCAQYECHMRLGAESTEDLEVRSEQLEQAVQKARQAVEEDRTCADACGQLGPMLCNLCRWDEAVTCFDNALELGQSADIEPTTQKYLKAAREAREAREAAARMAREGGEVKPSGESKPQPPPPAAASSTSRGCAVCGQQRADPPLTSCGGCKQAGVSKRRRPRYCSKECQVEHWKNGGHRGTCPGNK